MNRKKVFASILSISILGVIFCCSYTLVKENLHSSKLDKSKEAFAYCKANKLDTTFCILVDMSIHSGKKRLFVYDFKNKKITDSALVSHGCGSNPWAGDYTKTNPSFSNQDGSHLSALGKYKIGARGWSNWGINVNYKMHGLEATNSNAYKRLIVLHSWEEVSDEEIYPKGTPEGLGCPAVSNDFMRKLDVKLKAAKQPILFWIYQD